MLFVEEIEQILQVGCKSYQISESLSEAIAILPDAGAPL